MTKKEKLFFENLGKVACDNGIASYHLIFTKDFSAKYLDNFKNLKKANAIMKAVYDGFTSRFVGTWVQEMKIQGV